MDRRRFDHLTRSLASGGSRRGLLRGVAAAGAAAFAAQIGVGTGRWGVPRASAFNEICRQSPAASFVSKGACETLSCGPAERNCVCVQTLGHVPTCVRGFDPANPRPDCPTKDECSDGRPCPNGRVCAKVEGCCTRRFRSCLPRCEAR